MTRSLSGLLAEIRWSIFIPKSLTILLHFSFHRKDSIIKRTRGYTTQHQCVSTLNWPRDKFLYLPLHHCSSLHLGVEAIEEGAFGSPSTTVANFTLLYSKSLCGALSITVIIKGNEISNQSSNPSQGWLHFTLRLYPWERYEPISSTPPAMGKW